MRLVKVFMDNKVVKKNAELFHPNLGEDAQNLSATQNDKIVEMFDQITRAGK